MATIMAFIRNILTNLVFIAHCLRAIINSPSYIPIDLTNCSNHDLHCGGLKIVPLLLVNMCFVCLRTRTISFVCLRTRTNGKAVIK